MDKVLAIKGAEGSKLHVFGEGVRIPDEVPSDTAGGMGKLLHKAGRTNPTILLDNGKKVFGCECWWGNAEKLREKYKDYEFIEVDIDEVRQGVDA